MATSSNKYSALLSAAGKNTAGAVKTASASGNATPAVLDTSRWQLTDEQKQIANRVIQNSSDIFSDTYSRFANNYNAAYSFLKSPSMNRDAYHEAREAMMRLRNELTVLERIHAILGSDAPSGLGDELKNARDSYDKMWADLDTRRGEISAPKTLDSLPLTARRTYTTAGILGEGETRPGVGQRSYTTEMPAPAPTVGQRVGNVLGAAGEQYAGAMVGAAATGAEALSRLSSDASQADEIDVSGQRYDQWQAEKQEYIEEMQRRGQTPDPAMLAWYDTQAAPYARETAAEAIRQRRENAATERANLYETSAGLTRSGTEKQEAAKAGLGTIGSLLVDTGVAGTQMLMDLGAGLVTGGGSMAPMLVRSFGGGASEAAQNGADLGEQIYQGTKQAAIEWVTEKLFAGNPIYDEGGGVVTDAVYNLLYRRFGQEAVDRVLSTMAAKIAKVPMEMAAEGIEEVLSDYLNPWVDELASSFDGKQRDTTLPDRETVGRDFAVGALLGGLGNVVQTAEQTAQNAARTNAAGRTILRNNAQAALEDAGSDAGIDVNLGKGNARALGRAFNEVQEANTKWAIRDRLGVLGVEANDTMAEAVRRMAEDKALSHEQQRAYFGAFNQTRQVMQEYRDAMSGNISADNFWAYDALLDPAGIGTEAAEEGSAADETSDETGSEMVTAEEEPAVDNKNEDNVTTNARFDNDNEKKAIKNTGNAVLERERSSLLEAARTEDDMRLRSTIALRTIKMTDRMQEAEAAGDKQTAEAYRTILAELNGAAEAAAGRAPAEQIAQMREYITENYGGITNGREGSDLSDGAGRRDAGARTGVEAGAVRPDAARNDGGREADGGGDRVVPAEFTSAQELNIPNGTDNIISRLRPETAWTDVMHETARTASALGYALRYVDGGIEVKNPVTGRAQRVTGVTYGNEILVQADNRLYTGEQIARHEITHARIAEDAALLEDILVRMDLTDAQIDAIAARYAQIYSFIYGEVTESMTADEVQALARMYLEEFVCDAAAGLDRAGAHGIASPVRYTDAANEVIREREGMGYGAGGMPGARYSNNAEAGDTNVVVESGPSALERDDNSLAKDLAESIYQLQNMAPVAALTGREMNDRTKKPSEQIRDLFRRIGERVTRVGFGIVHLGEYGIDGVINHKPLNRAKMITLEAVPSVIRDGRLIRESDNWKGRGYPSYTFAAPVTVAGHTIYVAAVVDVRNGNQFYLNECVDSEGNYVRVREEPSDSAKTGVTVRDGLTSGPESSSKESITEITEESNRKNAEPKMRFSAAEDEGELGEAAYDAEQAGRMAANIEAMTPTELRRAVTQDRAELAALEKYAKQGGLTSATERSMANLRQQLQAEEKQLGEINKKVRQERKTAVERAVKRQSPKRAREDFIRDTLDHFQVKENRNEIGNMLRKFFEDSRSLGKADERAKTALFRRLMDAGLVRVEADESVRNIRSDLMHTRIYVPEDVRSDFGDNYALLRGKALGAGIILTSDPADSQIDVLNAELAERFPGTFRESTLDRSAMLENIVETAAQGKAENVTLWEMLQRTEDIEGWSVDDQIDHMVDWLDDRIDKALYAAGIEVEAKARSAMQLAKERAERRAMLERQAEQKSMREQQHKTMSALQWLKKNRKRAPEELKARYDEVISDINLYTLSAANEMRWSDKHQATYGDLVDMYKQAQKNDPNWMPSKELDRLMSMVDGRAIADMDIDELDTLYKAAVALRTEFYNRNNMINDEQHRLFSEVYRDSSEEIRASGGKGNLGKGLGKLTNAEMMTPMNLMNMMGGWKKDGQWYGMAKQLQAGERSRKGYEVRAKAMLDDFRETHRDWIRRADGQGKDAIWYEIEVPELMELHMGDKPIFGETKMVYMTPMQKVQMYLESKCYQNLQHMTGGRTFVDKDLYSKGKRSEALDQGTTVRMAPETVKKLVSDLTDEELELANLLERYYNGMAKEEINKVSNILYGYDKAMIDYYAPIFTDANFNKSTAGLFDVTAEGVGHMKSREQVSKNPSYNLSAVDAFERHIDQTSRFVGLAIPIRNMETLMNWYGDGTSMKKTISQKWGGEGVKYIEKLMTDMQSPQMEEKSVLESLGDKAVSNYISAVFGANPGIVFKQAASYPAAAAVLGFENLPTPGQLRATDENLINKYTPELAYRKLGYGTPELAKLRDNPNLLDRNKFTRFTLRGGAIQWMDVTTVKNLWAWAENYVRKNDPSLEVGTQEAVDAGTSPFYKAVAEAFNEAVNVTQPMYDTMNRARIMDSKSALVRTLTLFKTVPLQEYNTLRKYMGEAKNGDKASKRAAARSVASILASTVMLEGIAAAAAWVKNGLKYYQDDDDELTTESFAKEFGMDIAGDLAGIMIGGSEIFEAVTHTLGLSSYSSDFEIIGTEQINEIIGAVKDGAALLEKVVGGAMNVKAEGGDAGAYLKRNRGDLLGGVHDLAETMAKYTGGLPVENIEKYLCGVIAKVWPEAKAALEGYFDTTTKSDLSHIDAKELPVRLGDLLNIRNIEVDDGTSEELARLYLGGYKNAVPMDTPSKIDDTELTAYQMQVYDNEYSRAIGDSLDALVESEVYIEADDETRTKMLGKLYDYAAKLAKAEIAGGTPDAWVNRAQEATEDGVDLADFLAVQVNTSKQTEMVDFIDGMELSDNEKGKLLYWTVGTDAKQNLMQGVVDDGGTWADAYDTAADAIRGKKSSSTSSTSTTATETNEPDPTDRSYLKSLYADLTPPEGMTEVTKTQKYRAFVDAFDSVEDQVKALATEMTDSEMTKIAIGRSRNVTPEMYVASKEAMYAVDDNGNISQMEAKYALDGMDLTNEQKAVLWQLANKSWSPHVNPYNSDIGRDVYDELHGAEIASPAEEPESTSSGLNFQLSTANVPRY